MSRATSIISRLSTVLRKVGPLERTSYKRVTTRTGGDTLIGRPGSVAVSDTIFDPQPQYSRQARNVVGIGAVAEKLLASNQDLVANDYMFIFSPDALSISDLENSAVTIVLKDAAGNSEQFEITDYESTALTGVTVLYTVYAKSRKRP